MFSQEDKQLLAKLKKKSLLDLALMLPQSYVDTTLSQEIKINETITARAIVQDATLKNNKLLVQFFLPFFQKKIRGIFFKTTLYHQKTFTLNSEHIISGRVTLFNGFLQILQPKSLKNYGVVEPKYKSVLKESLIKSLIKKYLTKENLEKFCLNEEEIATLLKLHFPKRLDEIKKDGKLKDEIIFHLKKVEAINFLLKLRKKRQNFPPIKALKKDITPFIHSLPFCLTNDQLQAIKDIQKDLASSKKAARRLIIGDVGSGKTMVILAAAFIAGKEKSILMAPTSLLANQLFEEAQKFLRPFLTIALLTQKEQIGKLEEADFIIGTHALLYQEKLPKAALVMVDEQHRFGTNQRALLSHLMQEGSKHPHFLQFSATPIPRTQAMLESSAIDISLIKQLPFKKEITTQVVQKKDFKKLFAHIKKELAKNHQVLIVYPLVEPSDEMPYQSLNEASSFWQKHFDGVYITHGKDSKKQEVLLEFREKGNILLSTTVIEVGISLPRLTTIVIVGAERFGLATLHQLRGRVGRYGLKSFCFLYTNMSQIPKRLIEFCKINDGFEIARLDLALRESGDLLDGTIQSGRVFEFLDLANDEAIVSEVKSRIEQC